jgi:hypothetical protein
MEVATGLLVRGVRINGHYLLVDRCDVGTKQGVEPAWFVGQGGPHAAIANFEGRTIEGSISLPLRVMQDGSLEEGVLALVDAAQNPQKPIRIDTNHTIVSSYVTAEVGATDYNELLSLNELTVTRLKIRGASDQPIMVEASFTGIMSRREPTNYVAPPTGTSWLGRQLSFIDCSCSKFASAMRTARAYQIEIQSKVETHHVIPPIHIDNRDPDQTPPDSGSPYQIHHSFMPDMAKLVGNTETVFRGVYEETARVGSDRESYVHGGYAWRPNGDVRDDLVMHFGPLKATFKVPAYSPSEQPLAVGQVIRTVKFFSQRKPSAYSSSDELLSLG